MKKIALLLLLLSGSTSFAQTVINNYEYVIVPSRFSFSRSKDEFRLNTLTKLLLAKYGFKAYLDNEQPEEIADSNCKKLFADVDSKGGFFTTNVRIILKDCKNKVLYTSDEGTSREKDWGRAYNEAIRKAFESFPELNYKYSPAETVKSQPEKPAVQVAVVSETFNENLGILNAQPTANGYQLVDSRMNVIMKIYKTADASRFSAVKGDLHGDLILRNGQWFFEYYQNDQLFSESINVKF